MSEWPLENQCINSFGTSTEFSSVCNQLIPPLAPFEQQNIWCLGNRAWIASKVLVSSTQFTCWPLEEPRNDIWEADAARFLFYLFVVVEQGMAFLPLAFQVGFQYHLFVPKVWAFVQIFKNSCFFFNFNGFYLNFYLFKLFIPHLSDTMYSPKWLSVRYKQSYKILILKSLKYSKSKKH